MKELVLPIRCAPVFPAVSDEQASDEEANGGVGSILWGWDPEAMVGPANNRIPSNRLPFLNVDVSDRVGVNDTGQSQVPVNNRGDVRGNNKEHWFYTNKQAHKHQVTEKTESAE